MIKNYILIVFLYLPQITFGQVEFSGKINARNLISSNEEELPFWFFTNQRGRISKETNFMGLVSGTSNISITDKSSIELGGGILFQNGQEDKFLTDELYARFTFDWLEITGGRKQIKEKYNGLSAVNDNILWGINTRPMPGIQLKTNRALFFKESGSLGFEASWNEYFLGTKRYVKNARLHHKSFHLIYNPGNNWSIKGGIQHFAQWAGSSEYHGEQPTSFTDYLRVFSGREGGENAVEGDQKNVVGSHLGSYELYIKKTFSDFELSLIYNHIFEDGSGSRFANFPDGRYGIYLKKLKSRDWFTNVLYEFYYTRNQSQTPPHLYDMYFSNGVYKSGWTYENRVIGLPFITTNYYDDYPWGTSSIHIGNNLLIVHHFGISGFAFNKRNYKLLLSFRKNYGHYLNKGSNGVDYYSNDDPRGRFTIPRTVLSTYLELNLLDNFLNLDLIMGADISNENKNFGAGLNLSKVF